MGHRRHPGADGRGEPGLGVCHHRPLQLRGRRPSCLGSRFSALEPISQAVTARFGGIAAARGVSLRLDNGPQYTSHHFSQQISHWGMALNYAFPHQPQGNGVIERFFRTLKEQAIWGRTFRTAAEVRAAVTDFIARYNAAWRLERLGYLSPLDYRNRHLQLESRAA